MNPRLTAKDRGLIKGAMRRAFSRSELRRQVIIDSIIEHTDITRPRVKRWGKCAECGTPTPVSYLVVDHKLPVVPIEVSMEDMSFDDLVDSMWCAKSNLQALDETCHKTKTKSENKLRREFKKNKRSKK